MPERVIQLSIRGEQIAGVWQFPTSTTPVPGAVLLHGLTSHKERMSQAIGRSLLKRGVASIALDLPMHGERADSRTRPSFNNPLVLVGAWRAAVREALHATSWLRDQPEVDGERVGVVGYSLGGFLAIMAAADEPALKVVLLAAAGDLPDATPYAALARSIVDPLRAARKLDGRPLHLVNGKRDTTTRPAQAQRLFDAANEPKTLTWYEGGHWPPAAAIDAAAEWYAREMLTLARKPRTSSGRRAG